jgi:hypothetical protein
MKYRFGVPAWLGAIKVSLAVFGVPALVAAVVAWILNRRLELSGVADTTVFIVTFLSSSILFLVTLAVLKRRTASKKSNHDYIV